MGFHFDDIKAAEEYLNNINKFTSKHTIEETKAFLHKMGDPDKDMKIIHVAGTNGKGSTCAYLESILREGGFTTGLFTSPHLVHICERFAVNGQQVSDEIFLDALNEISGMLDEKDPDSYYPTYFEFLFFICMAIFRKIKVDYLILETGLGGRLDATNSVSNKLASVITRISLDHMQYLGDTVEKIAGEKAGIIKENTPVIYSDYVPEASAVIKNQALLCKSPAFPVGSECLDNCVKSIDGIAFLFSSRYYKNVSVSLDTIATYQQENASLAISTIEVLGLGELEACGKSQLLDRITPEVLVAGLLKCHWAGRMEEILPEVFIDGAHNSDGIRAFLETVAEDGFSGRRSLLFGVISDKDYETMVRELVVGGLFDELVLTSLHTGRSTDMDTLKRVFLEYPNVKYEIADNASAGLKLLIEKRDTPSSRRIYAAGSLYLVGELKESLANGDFCHD